MAERCTVPFSHTVHTRQNASNQGSPIILWLLDPEDAGSKLLTNVSNYLPRDTASHPSGLGSWTTPLWPSQMSEWYRCRSVAIYTLHTVWTLATHDPKSAFKLVGAMEWEIGSHLYLFTNLSIHPNTLPQNASPTHPLPYYHTLTQLRRNSNPQLPLHMLGHYFIWQLHAAISWWFACCINLA